MFVAMLSRFVEQCPGLGTATETRESHGAQKIIDHAGSPLRPDAVRLVQRQQPTLRHRRCQDLRVQLLPSAATSVLAPTLSTRVLDKDAAHGLGGGNEEVAAVVPSLPAPVIAHQATICLVDQGCRLKCLPGSLPHQS